MAEYVQVFYIPRDDSGELEILLRPRNEENVNGIVWEDVRNEKEEGKSGRGFKCSMAGVCPSGRHARTSKTTSPLATLALISKTVKLQFGWGLAFGPSEILILRVSESHSGRLRFQLSISLCEFPSECILEKGASEKLITAYLHWCRPACHAATKLGCPIMPKPRASILAGGLRTSHFV